MGKRTMPNESWTPFTDKFFRVTRKVTYFTLGNDHNDIFDYFTELDLGGGDCCRLIDASGIHVKPGWFIGVLNEPIVVCDYCYPKGVLAIFQGKEPGSHLALFSFEVGDEVV
jgi:hypothetical protein